MQISRDASIAHPLIGTLNRGTSFSAPQPLGIPREEPRDNRAPMVARIYLAAVTISAVAARGQRWDIARFPVE